MKTVLPEPGQVSMGRILREIGRREDLGLPVTDLTAEVESRAVRALDRMRRKGEAHTYCVTVRAEFGDAVRRALEGVGATVSSDGPGAAAIDRELLHRCAADGADPRLADILAKLPAPIQERRLRVTVCADLADVAGIVQRATAPLRVGERWGALPRGTHIAREDV